MTTFSVSGRKVSETNKCYNIFESRFLESVYKWLFIH